MADETQVEKDRAAAKARGEARRRAATNKRAPNPDSNPDRAKALARGENARAVPELRGALRRAGSANRFAMRPPPATSKQADAAKAMQDMSPLQKVLKFVDRVRGKQNQ